MNSDVVRLDHELAIVMEVVEQRTISFLSEQFNLVADGISRRLCQEESIVLRSMTAIVGVGSQAGIYIAYTYDDSLIREITKRYTAELSIAQEEEEIYAQETASDVVNVIIGNSTADLARRGELIALSPPVLMMGARTIHGRRQTATAAITLRFAEGSLDVIFVGPKILFDTHLLYQGVTS
jgi:CheY-specific phosphatase CheX